MITGAAQKMTTNLFIRQQMNEHGVSFSLNRQQAEILYGHIEAVVSSMGLSEGLP